jgi:hypothetical protein
MEKPACSTYAALERQLNTNGGGLSNQYSDSCPRCRPVSKAPHLKVNAQPIRCQINSGCGRAEGRGEGRLSPYVTHRENGKLGAVHEIAWPYGHEDFV